MRYLILLLAFPTLLGGFFISQGAVAGGPGAGFSQGIDHSARGTIASGGASVQATAAVMAVPFVVVGKAAEASTKIGESLWTFSSEPLAIADESPSSGGAGNIVVSPDRALMEN